ncbi:hypothetical protein, partial [Enterococcus faecium]|uniref:hypothetical protein n=1 Tax=Enterococcus faecium TaxID=1352 RepID=UPI0034E96592
MNFIRSAFSIPVHILESVSRHFIELQLSLYHFYMSAVHETGATATQQNPPPQQANPSEVIGALSAQDR